MCVSPLPTGGSEEDDLSPWYITLRPLPANVPAAVRVRRFLKAALRAYGLRCEGVQAVPPTDRPAAESVAKLAADQTEDVNGIERV